MNYNSDKAFPAYSFIAQLYDDIMSEIDYEFWADYLDGIIQEIKPDTESILELACGTGSLAYSMNELACYKMLATDLNADMIKLAIEKKEKSASYPQLLEFAVKDASNFEIDTPFDAIICVFDSLNYLITDEEVEGFFKHSYDALENNGLLLFDFVTEKHCIENANNFAYEESFYKDFRVVREAIYPNENRNHTTSFNIYKDSNSLDLVAREIHIQKPYSLIFIEKFLIKYNFSIAGIFGDFTDNKPTTNTKRITLAAICQKSP